MRKVRLVHLTMTCVLQVWGAGFCTRSSCPLGRRCFYILTDSCSFRPSAEQSETGRDSSALPVRLHILKLWCQVISIWDFYVFLVTDSSVSTQRSSFPRGYLGSDAGPHRSSRMPAVPGAPLSRKRDLCLRAWSGVGSRRASLADDLCLLCFSLCVVCVSPRGWL